MGKIDYKKGELVNYDNGKHKETFEVYSVGEHHLYSTKYSTPSFSKKYCSKFIGNLFVLNHNTHYGDGQHYFNCDYCDRQMCFWTTEETTCSCGAKVKVISGYEER